MKLSVLLVLCLGMFSGSVLAQEPSTIEAGDSDVVLVHPVIQLDKVQILADTGPEYYMEVNKLLNEDLSRLNVQFFEGEGAFDKCLDHVAAVLADPYIDELPFFPRQMLRVGYYKYCVSQKVKPEEAGDPQVLALINQYLRETVRSARIEMVVQGKLGN